MTRLNLLLFAILLVCALGLVTSQHRARQFYIELQRQDELTKQLEMEWGQLQLEQSTWAMPSRVERIASEHLRMQVPESARIQMVNQ